MQTIRAARVLTALSLYDEGYWSSEGKSETCVPQEGQCSQQQLCVCVVWGLLVCIMLNCFVCLQCCVLCSAVHSSGCAALDICFTCMCVFNWTAGTFVVVKLSPSCYLCFARSHATLSRQTVGCSSIQRKDSVCSIWVEGVMGEKCVAVLSPWSVSPLACAGPRCVPHQYRDPKCSDLVAAAAN